MTIFYVLFAVCALVFFLFQLFPEKEVADYIGGQIETRYPGSQMEIETVQPLFPVGACLNAVTLFRQQAPLVNITEVRFRPSLWQLLRLRREIKYAGTAYYGGFFGEVDFDNSWRRPISLTLTLSELLIQDAVLKGVEGEPELSGTLNGNCIYTAGDKKGGHITAKLVLTEASLVLPLFVDVMDVLTFTSVETEITLQHHTLNINKSLFQGPQIEGTATGSVQLGIPVNRSRLNIELEIRIQPEYQESLNQMMPVTFFQTRPSDNAQLKIKVFGTLDKPSFSLSR